MLYNTNIYWVLANMAATWAVNWAQLIINDTARYYDRMAILA
jgi:hypothetical protein